MRLLRLLGVALIAVFALGVVAVSSASALPSVLFLSGEKVPVTLLAESNSRIELKSTTNIEGEGLKSSLALPTAANNLGPYTLWLLKLHVAGESTNTCKTGTDTAGNVLITGNEAHLVYDTLAPTLGVAVLFLIAEFEIVCTSGLTFKFKGSLLGLIKPINKEILTTESFEVMLHCIAGTSKQEEETYYNGSGTATASKLEVNAGLGFKAGCENVGETVKYKPSKMIEVMG